MSLTPTNQPISFLTKVDLWKYSPWRILII